VCAWKYFVVALIYFKFLSKYFTGVAEERQDNPVAMAIVMVEEILYPYPDVHIVLISVMFILYIFSPATGP
jgi:hypothetical protein